MRGCVRVCVCVRAWHVHARARMYVEERRGREIKNSELGLWEEGINVDRKFVCFATSEKGCVKVKQSEKGDRRRVGAGT